MNFSRAGEKPAFGAPRGARGRPLKREWGREQKMIREDEIRLPGLVFTIPERLQTKRWVVMKEGKWMVLGLAWGQRAAELLGGRWWEFVHTDDLSAAERLSSGCDGEEHMRLLVPGESWVASRWSAAALPAGYSCLCQEP